MELSAKFPPSATVIEPAKFLMELMLAPTAVAATETEPLPESALRAPAFWVSISKVAFDIVIPELAVTAPVPLSFSVPASKFVLPVWLMVPVTTKVPSPLLVTEPLPTTLPSTVRPGASVPSAVTLKVRTFAAFCIRIGAEITLPLAALMLPFSKQSSATMLPPWLAPSPVMVPLSRLITSELCRELRVALSFRMEPLRISILLASLQLKRSDPPVTTLNLPPLSSTTLPDHSLLNPSYA